MVLIWRVVQAAFRWHSDFSERMFYKENIFRIVHSRVAIIKPQRKTADQALEEVEEAIKKKDAGLSYLSKLILLSLLRSCEGLRLFYVRFSIVRTVWNLNLHCIFSILISAARSRSRSASRPGGGRGGADRDRVDRDARGSRARSPRKRSRTRSPRRRSRSPRRRSRTPPRRRSRSRLVFLFLALESYFVWYWF